MEGKIKLNHKGKRLYEIFDISEERNGELINIEHPRLDLMSESMEEILNSKRLTFKEQLYLVCLETAFRTTDLLEKERNKNEQ